MPPNLMDQQFCLRWNNFQANITSQFETLRDDEDFTDVTLACDGQRLLAHKLVLSACSPYFKELFKANPCSHPIVFMRDVEANVATALIEFMYTGEVNVAQAYLPSFLKTAESLRIRGLTETNSKDNVTTVAASAASVTASSEDGIDPDVNAHSTLTALKEKLQHLNNIAATESAPLSSTTSPSLSCHTVAADAIASHCDCSNETTSDLSMHHQAHSQQLLSVPPASLPPPPASPITNLPPLTLPPLPSATTQTVSPSKRADNKPVSEMTQCSAFAPVPMQTSDILHKTHHTHSIGDIQPKMELSDYLTDDGVRPHEHVNFYATDVTDLPGSIELLPHMTQYQSKDDQNHAHIENHQTSSVSFSKSYWPYDDDKIVLSEAIMPKQQCSTHHQSTHNRYQSDSKYSVQHSTEVAATLLHLSPNIVIDSSKLNLVSEHWSSYKRVTRALAAYLFTRTELATCSVTGRRNTDGVNKPGLDPDKVRAITSYITSRFPEVTSAKVRLVLSYKCKDTAQVVKARRLAQSNGEPKRSIKKPSSLLLKSEPIDHSDNAFT